MPENPAPPTETPPSEQNSRRNFLRLSGAGGVGAAALFLAACGGSDKKSDGGGQASAPPKSGSGGGGSEKGDLEILNYALTLEYLEADFYSKVIAANILKPKEQEIAKNFGDEEQQHVEAVKSTVQKLGGTPAAKPKSKFDVSDRMKVLQLAATVENLGASAYLGQTPRIKSPDVLAAALSIHSVEARHAAALNQLLGMDPDPDGAFAKPADMKTVLAAVKPFIVS